MTTSFDFRIEWQDAPGVTTPELAATWARYELWIGGRCVTQVETADSTYRRGVYGSLYPLASWIASNWWLLTSHVRPTAIDTWSWSWRYLRDQPWLRHHNLRAAGDGMAWPDLTVVPEGAVAQLAWRQEYERHSGLVRFASDGRAWLTSEDLRASLTAIVRRVLDRLEETGLPKTELAEEWRAVGAGDAEEQDFCRTAARLGLDPYSATDETADAIIRAADAIPAEIAGDFFDSVEVAALRSAAGWTRKAESAAGQAAAAATETIYPIQQSTDIQSLVQAGQADTDRPWLIGFEMARVFRRELATSDTDPFDTDSWVGIGHVDESSHGIYALAAVSDNKCGVVLGNQTPGPDSRRFGQARTLGKVLIRPGQQKYILSAARPQEERIARAFAAELLAPASGIKLFLEESDNDDDAMEAAASHFKVSPLIIRHQRDNQLAGLRSF